MRTKRQVLVVGVLETRLHWLGHMRRKTSKQEEPGSAVEASLSGLGLAQPSKRTAPKQTLSRSSYVSQGH